MRKWLFCLAFVLFAVLAVRSQRANDYLCSGQLKVESGMKASLPVDFQNFTFFGSLEDSVGHVEIANNTAHAIRYYLLIFELYDSAGKYVVSVPVFNFDTDQNIPFDVGFKSWILANWPGGHFDPIGPMARSRKTFHTPLSVLTCPTTARISMIRLRYDDGTEFQSTSSILITPAIVVEPAIMDTEGYRHWTPLTISGTIQVDSTAHAHLETINQKNVEFEHWFERELSAWKFAPASRNGMPTMGKITFFLVIGRPTDLKAQIESLRQSGSNQAALVLEALPPGSPFGSSWAFSAGGQVIPASKRRSQH